MNNGYCQYCGLQFAGMYAMGTPFCAGYGVAAVGAPPIGAPAIGTPAIGTPAIGTPAIGTPAIGTPYYAGYGVPAIGTPAIGTPTFRSYTVEQEEGLVPGDVVAPEWQYKVVPTVVPVLVFRKVAHGGKEEKNMAAGG